MGIIKVWQIKDGHKFFDAPPIQRGGLCPSPLSWFWEISVTVLSHQIQQRWCHARSLVQALRDWQLPLFWKAHVGYSLLEHSCHAGRSPSHMERPHWCSSHQPQINPEPKASINCQSWKGDISHFQLSLKMPLNDCRTSLDLSSTASQTPSKKYTVELNQLTESCEIISYCYKPL